MEDDKVMKRINERKETEEIKDKEYKSLTYFKAPFPLVQNLIEIVLRKMLLPFLKELSLSQRRNCY
jgi:hypothetical protein